MSPLSILELYHGEDMNSILDKEFAKDSPRFTVENPAATTLVIAASDATSMKPGVEKVIKLLKK